MKKLKYLYVFLAFVTLSLLYLFTLRGYAGNYYPQSEGAGRIKAGQPPFETSMERGRYAQIVSIAKNNTFNVDAYADFLKPDLGWYNGHYYSAFPPGVALVSAPIF